jgi:hypothetical protein
METPSYPFHASYDDGKTQLSQKQIQFVFNISPSHVDQCQNRMKEHPDRVLYNKGGEKRDVFNVFKYQVGIRFHSQHNSNKNNESKTSVTTSLNGLGKRNGNKEQNNTYDLDSIWKDMYVMGVTKNNVNVSDPGKKQQLQTNVIVHGDAQIYNNGTYNWYPGQILIVKPPSPNLHNIRLQGFPENAFYPIVEPLQKNMGMIPNADNFLKYVHNLEKSNYFAPWVLDLFESIIHHDIQLKKILGRDKSTMEKESLYPLNDVDQKVHKMFDLLKEVHHRLNQKIVGKACSYAPSGHIGNVIVTK